MLRDDLYTIQELTHDNSLISTVIVLNTAHAIFDGHFPGQPVLPGVCMMQMVREFLEMVLERSLQLSVATNVKFISLIVPTISPLVQMRLSYKIADEQIIVAASATASETVCFKFQGVYVLSARNSYTVE